MCRDHGLERVFQCPLGIPPQEAIPVERDLRPGDASLYGFLQKEQVVTGVGGPFHGFAAARFGKVVGRRLGRLPVIALGHYPFAGRVGGHMVETVQHEVEMGRIQDRHVDRGRIGVDISCGSGHGLAASSGHCRGAVANDEQVNVGARPVAATGTGSKEQFARHPGHLRCGGRNLTGTRIVAQIAAGFGLDGPSGREQRRWGVLVAGKGSQRGLYNLRRPDPERGIVSISLIWPEATGGAGQAVSGIPKPFDAEQGGTPGAEPSTVGECLYQQD